MTDVDMGRLCKKCTWKISDGRYLFITIKRRTENVPGIIAMLVLMIGLFCAEYAVVIRSGSKCLMADAYHVLSEAGVLLVGLLAKRLSGVRTNRNTFGWARFEITGVIVNGIFLMGLSFNLFVRCLDGIFDAKPILIPNRIFQISAISVLVKILCFALFYQKGFQIKKFPKLRENTSDDDELSERSPLLRSDDFELFKHWEGDHFQFRIVVIQLFSGLATSLVTLLVSYISWKSSIPHNHNLDLILALILVIIMVASEIFVVKEASMILLQKVPSHIEPIKLKNQLIKSVPGVLAVHELHIWLLAGKRIVCTAHILCDGPERYNVIAENVKEFLHNQGIHSSTIQPEFVDAETFEQDSIASGETHDSVTLIRRSATACTLTCRTESGDVDKDCVKSVCCPNPTDKPKQRPPVVVQTISTENTIEL